MARLGRVGLLTTLLAGGLLLSGCGVGSAVVDARQACSYVHRALTLERASAATSKVARRSLLESRALAELLRAVPYAAAATSADGSWNPLQTTLQEANRVPLRFEVPALTQLCKVADSQSPYL